MSEVYKSTDVLAEDQNPLIPREIARGSVVIPAASFSAGATGYNASVSVNFNDIVTTNIIPDYRAVHYMDLSAGVYQWRQMPYTKIDTNGLVDVAVRSTVANNTLPGKEALTLTFLYYSRLNTVSANRDTAFYDQTIYYVLYSNDLVRLT